MKQMKKAVSLILALVMMMSCFCIVTSAATLTVNQDYATKTQEITDATAEDLGAVAANGLSVVTYSGKKIVTVTSTTPTDKKTNLRNPSFTQGAAYYYPFATYAFSADDGQIIDSLSFTINGHLFDYSGGNYYQIAMYVSSSRLDNNGVIDFSQYTPVRVFGNDENIEKSDLHLNYENKGIATVDLTDAVSTLGATKNVYVTLAFELNYRNVNQSTGIPDYSRFRLFKVNGTATQKAGESTVEERPAKQLSLSADYTVEGTDAIELADASVLTAEEAYAIRYGVTYGTDWGIAPANGYSTDVLQLGSVNLRKGNFDSAKVYKLPYVTYRFTATNGKVIDTVSSFKISGHLYPDYDPAHPENYYQIGVYVSDAPFDGKVDFSELTPVRVFGADEDNTTSDLQKKNGLVSVDMADAVKALGPVESVYVTLAFNQSWRPPNDFARARIFKVQGTATEKDAYAVDVTSGTASAKLAPAGAKVTVTAEGKAGKKFVSWNASGVTLADATGRVVEFTMPANAVTLEATYADITVGGQPIGETTEGDVFFDYPEYEGAGEKKGIDGGFYGPMGDIGSAGTGALSFTACFREYAGLSVEKYGMYVYCTSVEKKVYLTAETDSLAGAEGYFYAVIDGIDKDDFNKTVYAVPYIVIDGVTYSAAAMSASVNDFAGSWLGEAAN